MRRRITVTPDSAAVFTVDGISGLASRAFTVVGDFDLEVEDLDSYVQVQFNNSTYLYTYRDPSGTLKVGDLVKVPAVNYYASGIGTVAALGRGSWDGKVKDIEARLVTEALV